MAELNTFIGERIAKLRKEHHMTQEQLAEELDISVKHCSAVERGVSSLSTEKYIELCDLLDTSLDYIIRGYSDNILNRMPPSLIETYANADENELKVLNEYYEMYLKIRSQNDK